MVPLTEKPTALVSEAKAEFIPKAKPRRKPVQKKKPSPPPYSINISSFLKKTVSDSPAPKPLDSGSTTERLPWETDKQPLNLPWTTGFVTALVLLFGQIIFFEHHNWAQNSSFRPRLELLCQWLGCRLSDYEQLDELVVLQGSFTPNADNTFLFKAVINNQADFRQRLPNIKLTLLDYNEQLLAQRIFLPKDYLSDDKRLNSSIAADETVEARLVITGPKTPIGGYSFDLIY